MRRLAWVTVVGLGSAVMGCDGDDGDTTGATTVATTVATGPGSGDAAGTQAGGSGDVTSADSSTGGAVGLPQCVKSCLFPGDCCPPGAEGCPSSNYPYAFSCVDDLCVEPGCGDDEQCGGTLSCLPVGGVGTCLQSCRDDATCAAISEGSICTGVADDGQGYCFEPCTPGTLSCGNLECDAPTGLCTCANSSQCVVGFTCV